jgi:5,10-methylenetetrahydromethanopterin reductase
MKRVPFGLGYAPARSASETIQTARLAEDLGFDVFWVTDSHMVAREVYTLLGTLALSTTRIDIGPGVSHLAGRHPSVIASALATLDELAPGRVRLGIGVGDSGPRMLGLPRASLRELEASVLAIRALLQGETVDDSGHLLRLGFAPTAHAVPIYVAGSSQRAFEMSGRAADGALISGAPDQLASSVLGVRASERAAGRPPGSTRILFWTTASVDDDRQVARAAVRGSVARRALNSLGRAARQGTLDPEDREALERLQREQQSGYRLEIDNAELVPERWIDRFAVAGTPDEVRVRLERALADGADEIAMILMGPRPSDRGSRQQITRFAESVLQPMQRALASTGA